MFLDIERPGTSEDAPEEDHSHRTEEDDSIRCARCDAHITDEGARTASGGAHVHTRTNPGGFRFEIGLFSRAPGCLVRGLPETADTWFPPHPWQFAACRSCRAHNGWFWSDGDAGFFGLILERIV